MTAIDILSHVWCYMTQQIQYVW